MNGQRILKFLAGGLLLTMLCAGCSVRSAEELYPPGQSYPPLYQLPKPEQPIIVKEEPCKGADKEHLTFSYFYLNISVTRLVRWQKFVYNTDGHIISAFCGLVNVGGFFS